MTWLSCCFSSYDISRRLTAAVVVGARGATTDAAAAAGNADRRGETRPTAGAAGGAPLLTADVAICEAGVVGGACMISKEVKIWWIH